MWTELPTLPDTLDCAPPFSFFFDLIEPYLKAKSANEVPLHRLCTLARKQGAQKLFVESALAEPTIRAEIDALDQALQGGGAAEAIRVSFLAAGDTDDEAADRLIGQAIIINYRSPGQPDFSHSYVFEASVATPKRCDSDGKLHPLLNNFIYAEHELECSVRGHLHQLRGVHYCQQNGETHVCAHAALRMALTSKRNQEVDAAYINETAGVTEPANGLAVEHIQRVIEAQGLHPQVIEASALDRQQYISVLGSIVESGDQALLVFSTGNTIQDGDDKVDAEHVVLVVGHTRHTDEWHPEAIRDYSAVPSAPFYSASDWIDHLLIHDDNFGPYYTLSSHALEFSDKVKAQYIIGIRQRPTNLVAPFVELLAASTLLSLLPALAPFRENRWLAYISRGRSTPVLRPLLVTRDDYLQHLRSSRGHDGSAVADGDLEALAALPNHFWMVEFSLPALFTGNHSKLGEVLIAAQADEDSPLEGQSLVLGMRVSGWFLQRQDDPARKLAPRPIGLKAHSPIFRLNNEGSIW